MKTSLFQLVTLLSVCATGVSLNAATSALRHEPLPYNCGPLAVLEVGRHLQPENKNLLALASMESLAPGFSMLELSRVSRPLGLDLVPVRVSSGDGLPLPAVALLHGRHYVAVFADGPGKCRVVDPSRGSAYTIEQAVLVRDSAGLFLVPRSHTTVALPPLSEAHSLAYSGGATTNGVPLFDERQEECPNDAFENTPKCPKCDNCQVGTQDEPNDANCSSCGSPGGGSTRGQAMPVWRVTEPDINLWIVDTPLFYTTSHDDWMTFRLIYKQRNDHDNTNVFGVGKGWECNLRSHGIPDFAITGNIKRFSGGGGQQSFVPNGQTREWNTCAKLSDAGGSTFDLRGPRGGAIRMNFLFTNVADIAHYFPSERIDPLGRTNKFNYVITNGIVLLTSIVDADGKTSSVSYQNTSFPTHITKVQDPYGRHADLAYDSQGRLTNITDMIGLATGFSYNASGLITSMTTPYGTTLFTCTTNEPPTAWSNQGYANVVNRSVRVVEPNGATHLYFYRHSSDHLNPDSEDVLLPDDYADVPDTQPLSNSFDNSQLSQRNSFYWGPRQYALLNGYFRASPTNFNLMMTNDYRHARIKHWLWQSTNETVTVSRSLSMLRSPCPDANQEGARIWFDYEGKHHSNREGTNSRPSFVARVLPDGTSSFRFTERSNSWENPTMVIQSWSSNDSTVLLRTNLITYEEDEIRVSGIYALRGETQQLVMGFGGYTNSLPHLVTNALLQVTKNWWDPNSRQLLGVTRPSGLNTTNRYFASGSFIGWLEWSADYAQEGGTNVLFNTNSFTYANGVVQTAKDTRGHTLTLTWDNLERLTEAAFANGSYKFAYCLLDLTNRVDRLDRTNWFGHDSMRRLTWHMDERGNTNQLSYCDCGSLEGTTDPLGRQTTFNYDNAGRLTDALYPGSISYSFGYDPAGRLTHITDGNGHSTVRYFNNQGLITVVSNQVGQVFRAIPDIDDLPALAISAEGVVTVNTYDVLGRLLTRTWPDNGVEEFVYGVRGLTNWYDQLENEVRLTLDADGRLVKRERIHAVTNTVETTRFEYSRAGDLIKLWDGADNLTQWAYDSLGRATGKTNAAGVTDFTWQYDAEDRLTNRLDALSQTTGYAYDAAGNLTNVNYSGTSTTDLSMQYDALDRLTNLVDGVGTSKYAYATSGRLESENGPWDDDTVSYLYNLVGLRQRMSVPRSGSTWTADYGYDAARRLTNVLSTAGSFTNQFLTGIDGVGGAGRLIEKLKFPNGIVATNDFDPLGRLLETTLRNAGGTALEQFKYGYELDGRMKAATNVFGTRWTFTHDALSQLKTAVSTNSSGTGRLHEQFGYSYDLAGNLTNRSKNALTQGFAADTLNQLTSSARSGTLTVAGTTGAAATSVTVNSQAADVYADATFAKAGFTVTNGVNSFTAIGQDNLGRSSTNTVTVSLPATVSFNYDAKGNLLGDGQRQFVYDDENQLVNAYVTNSWKAGFAYDGFGRRREKAESTWSGSAWVTNLVVRYVYDGMLVLQERHFNPTVSMQSPVDVVTYTRGLDLSGGLQGAGGIGGLLARTDSKGTVYYQTDGRGNVTALFNASGAIVARYAYDPFGNTLSASGPMAEANVYRFSSKEIHPGSGLYYYGSRFYDPNLQRWMNRDPIGESGGVNLSMFVRNSPLNHWDPWGLLDEICLNATKDRELIKSNKNIQYDAVFTIIGHGDPARGLASTKMDPDNPYFYSPEELVNKIRKHDRYKPGMPVLLISCSLGQVPPSRGKNKDPELPYAQRVADHLGAVVFAADAKVYDHMQLIRSDYHKGQFVGFTPSGGEVPSPYE